jgi:hypothetical protein
MPPSIELSAETFKRLQAHAVPLVDTIESVISRIMDEYEKIADGQQAPLSESQIVRAFNPNTPPDLTHAKILGVTFNEEKLGRGQDNWNGLLHAAVRAAKKSCKTSGEFKEIMLVNFVAGEKHDEGYRPVADTDVSVQGQDANGAWRAASHIAQRLGLDLSVKFAWREKEGAAYPGVTGQLIVKDLNR